MDNFTYSVIRSWNQFTASQLGTAAIGTDAQVVLNAFPGKVTLDKDTVACQFYNETKTDYCGRRVGTTTGQSSEFLVQLDVFSPPNNAGEPRQAANRKLKDTVEEVFKPKARIDLLAWDGTGGTTTVGAMYCRQEMASWLPDPDMEGWCRWVLQYRVKAVDYE